MSETKCVWIPGEHVISLQVTVPAVKRSQWLEMIPWLLEEQLLDAIADMEYICSEPDQQHRVTVLAARRSWLEQYRHSGAQARVLAAPDYLSLPWCEGHISLLCLGDRSLIRYGEFLGGAGSSQCVSGLIENILLQQKDAWSLDVYSVDETRPELAPSLLALSDSPPRFLPMALAPDAPRLAFGGAPGTSQRFEPWKAWLTRKPVVCCLSLVLAALALLGGNHWRSEYVESRQSLFLDGLIKQNYQALFGEPYGFSAPDLQRVVSRRMIPSEAMDNWSRYEHVLQGIEQVLSHCSGCQLQSLTLKAPQVVATFSSVAAMAPEYWPQGFRPVSVIHQGAHWVAEWDLSTDDRSTAR